MAQPSHPKKFAAFNFSMRIAWCADLILGGLALYAQQPGLETTAHGAGTTLFFVFGGLLGATALIAAAETAIFSLDKLDISQFRASKDFSARLIVQLLDRPNDSLVTMLMLNNFMNL